MTPRRRGTRCAVPPLAVTMGEPAGIGGDITLKAWVGHRTTLPCFFIIDDPTRLEALARKLGLDVPICVIDGPDEAEAVFAKGLPVLARPLAGVSTPGRPDPRNVGSIRASIENAVCLTKSGRAGAVVTNPIHKESLYGAGFPFPGHTEFLASLAGTDKPVAMMLACPTLRVIPATIHTSLKDAIARLDVETIVTAATVAEAGLKRYFGIAKPKLAVAGLNPHAGEGGAMGAEDIEIVAPAIAALRAKGIDAYGPLPPDTMFSARVRATYDAAICMYHDQALIPIKTLDMDGAVNVTLGLPFVRTSPDHGTAFDIAGTGRASEASLIAALIMAAEMASRAVPVPAE